MTASNHVLAGALIALVIKEPAIALPAALTSHFLLDAMPHFGFKNWQERSKYKKLMKTILFIDAFLLVVAIIMLLKFSANWLVFACAFLALSPDLMWVYRYAIPERFGTIEPSKGNMITRFHSGIQIREFRHGFIIEYITFMTLILTVSKLL